MSETRLTAEQAQARVAQQLQAMVDVMGPRRCAHAPLWEECEEDECQFEDTEPIHEGTMMLANWIVIAEWTDVETGGLYNSMLCAPKQRRTLTNGMLHTALYER